MKRHGSKSAKTPWLIIALMLLGASPGLFAGVTSLLLDSAPGEPIGGGEFHFYTPHDGTLYPVFGLTTPGHVHLNFFGTGGPWFLEFAAPPGTSFAPGVYENAVQPHNRGPGQPGISVHGEEQFCSSPSGRFEVKQIGFDTAGELSAFWVTFEQTCEGAVMRGEVRLEADVPVVVDAPSRRAAYDGQPLSFTVEGHDVEGSPLALFADSAPQGSTFADFGDGTGVFDWLPAGGGSGSYWVAFRGQGAPGESDTVYTRIDNLPDFDDFDHPIPFSNLPLRSWIDNPDASVAADDPQPVCREGWPSHEEMGTVWYAFTPVEDARIRAFANEPEGVTSSPIVSVYSGERGSLELLACGPSVAKLDVVSGRTYNIMVDVIPPSTRLGLLVEALPPPPPNDRMEDATIVTALPFSESLDITGAAFELTDPRPCGIQLQNVWYAFTPSESTRVTVENDAYYTNVFSGPPDALVPVRCGSSAFSFTASAGQTYRIMVTWGLIYSIFPDILQMSISGRPPLGIDVTLASDGTFDRSTGSTFVHGTVACTRPASVTVSGTLRQGRDNVQGSFFSTVACSGTTAWSATMITPRGGSGRLKGGPVTVLFDGFGRADDDPSETARDSGSATLRLRSSPSP